MKNPQKIKVAFDSSLHIGVLHHSAIIGALQDEAMARKQASGLYHPSVAGEIISEQKKYFVRSDVKNADIVIYNLNCGPFAEAVQRDKHVVIVYPHDDGHTYFPLSEYDNKTVIKRSIDTLTDFASIAMPAFPHHGWPAYTHKFQHIEYMPQPLVSFFGNIKSHTSRALAIDNLVQSEKCWTNVQHFRYFQQDDQTRHAMKKPMAQSLLDSHYGLSARGAGNYSYRLYETMSMGRPPIHVSTDDRLPFGLEEDQLICVKAYEPDTFMDLHAQFDSKTWVEYQRHIHNLWINKLSPMAFPRMIYDYFTTNILSVS